MTSLPANSTVEPGDTHAERQRDVEYAREIGLEEMHDAERADEDADADAMPQPEQRRHHAEIDAASARSRRLFSNAVDPILSPEIAALAIPHPTPF